MGNPGSRAEHQRHTETLISEPLADAGPPQAPLVQFPLSYGQRALWFLHKLIPECSAYNIARAVRMRRVLDEAAFERAFRRLSERHAVLRTTFSERDGEPVQSVHEHLPPDFRVEDASGWDANQQSDRLAQEIHRPFDLEQGPLVRVRVFSRGPEDHTILLALHHTITDLWSLALLLFEIGPLYSAELRGTDSGLRAPRAEYAEFVQSQLEMVASEEGEGHRAYWAQQLSGELPVLSLPTDLPRPTVQSFAGSSRFRVLGAELTQSIKAFSDANHVPIHITFLAAFATLLYRYTGQKEMLIGFPKANRRPRMARVLGYIVNPVALRVDLSGDPSFASLLDQLLATEREAAEHDVYPLALIAEQVQPQRDTSRSPIIQVMFTWQKTTKLLSSRELTAFAVGAPGGEMSLGDDLPLESQECEHQVSPFDLTLLMAESGPELIAALEFNTGLFHVSTILRMLDQLSALLDAAMADASQKVSTLPMLSESERRSRAMWNATSTEDSPIANVLELIEPQARRTPEVTAIICENASLTYGDLNARANQVARYLKRLGVGTGVPVGVFLDRSAQAIVAMLGVLKSGGVYLPLDPAYPAERLSYMLKDSQVALVLTSRELMERLPSSEARPICLDSDGALFEQESGDDLESRAAGSDPACMIYTSGSTGVPKGVVLPHGALAVHCRDIGRHYGLTPRSRVLQFASLSFDQSLEQILPTLAVGATVVMRGNEMWSADEFNRQVVDHGITVANLPTAYWHELCREWVASPGAAPSDQLELVIPGGDRILPDAVRLWFQSPMRAVRLLNAYGPTETTVTATTFEITEDVLEGMSSIPIGRPLANRVVHILDEEDSPCPIGVAGELCLGGAGVASGYYGLPAETDERFVPDPFALEPDARMYRTGDLASWRSDGTILFLGRRDGQVKVRGFRVELGEIETALGSHPHVRQVSVQAPESPAGVKVLQAFVVPEPSLSAPTPSGLRRFLRERIPEYMVPSSVVLLERFPLTPSGKVDGRALVEMAAEQVRSENDYVAPRTLFEEDIAAIWAGVLHVERVGIHDNFFDLGGHSLLVMQVISRLRDAFQVEISARDLFESPTVTSLAELVEERYLSDEDDQDLADLLAEVEQLSQDEAQRALDEQGLGREQR